MVFRRDEPAGLSLDHARLRDRLDINRPKDGPEFGLSAPGRRRYGLSWST